MIVEQIYTGCLAQGAYYIESDGEVAIIDPLREVTSYIKKAERANIGHQKQVNYALKATNKAQFIQEVTEGLATPPAYFPLNVLLNKQGVGSMESVMNRGNKPLSILAFELEAKANNALVLDTRSAADFAKGFIPNSINIGLGGQFAPWVGEMITDIKQPILIVAAEGMEEESLIRLSRVGYDGTIGYLEGGFAAWKATGKDFDTVNRLTPEAFAKQWHKEDIVFDLRKDGEYAASILKARGIDNFIEGGFGAIAKTDVPKTDFMCSFKTTLAA